jgi:hypothetical protein
MTHESESTTIGTPAARDESEDVRVCLQTLPTLR